MSLFPEFDWKQLEKRAERVLSESLRTLPKELKPLASEVPVVVQRWAPGDEEAIDLLGEYIAYEAQSLGEGNGAIALYLGAIALYCEEESGDFEEEVRRTYLHELGHHLGWDEDDLAVRDLD